MSVSRVAAVFMFYGAGAVVWVFGCAWVDSGPPPKELWPVIPIFPIGLSIAGVCFWRSHP